jgi:hypothetical protein
VIELINHIATADQGFDRLIAGLVNLSAYQLQMIEALSGIPPESFLGNFASDEPS